jgi:hypothetical protein
MGTRIRRRPGTDEDATPWRGPNALGWGQFVLLALALTPGMRRPTRPKKPHSKKIYRICQVSYGDSTRSAPGRLPTQLTNVSRLNATKEQRLSLSLGLQLRNDAGHLYI